MQSFIKRAFNIHEGEMRVAFLMQFYIFLVITVLLLVKPTVNALFLSNLGVEQLPYGYLLVASVAVLSTLFYNRLVKRFSIKIVAISTIVLFSILFFALGYSIYEEIMFPPVLYFYYLILSLFGVLVTSQFWTISNMVFDAREAKRLFGFIGAGAIAGGIAGGYITTILSSYFGNSVVIFVASALLLLCVPIILTVWHMRINQLGHFVQSKRKASEKEISGSALKIVMKSKHLVYLASIVGVSVIVAKLVDYQFSDFSNKAFSDPHDLASFFGFWFSTFNVVALLIQLFLTNRLLSFFGVTANLLVLPVGIALGSILFLTFPELWVLVLIKGMDGSFKQSINKASFELSILPVEFNVKKRAKPFIDVVVDSIATGLAGCLLLLVIKKLDVSTEYISVLIIFFLFLWLLFVYRLRETYFDSFRRNILSLVDRNNARKSDLDESSIHRSNLEVLTSGNEKEILSLLASMSDDLQDYYKPYVLKLLDHPSNRVKSAAIREIYHFKYGTATDKMVDILQNEKDDEVVFEAMNYVLFHTSVRKDSSVFLSYLDSEKDYIKNAALLCLAKASRQNKAIARKFHLEDRVEAQIEEFTAFENEHRKEEISELLVTIGISRISKYYYFIDKYLDGENQFILTYAIMAAGRTMDATYVPKLLKLLKNDKHRQNCVKSLTNFGEGLSEIILDLLESMKFDDSVKLHIPEIIEGFETKETGQVLVQLLGSKDQKVRHAAAKSLSLIEDKLFRFKVPKKMLNDFISKECEDLTNTLAQINAIENALNDLGVDSTTDAPVSEKSKLLELLIEHLNLNFHQGIETVFYLLSLSYRNSDMEVAFMGVRDKSRESRTNAIEFLDNLLELKLKTKILPLMEYHFLRTEETPAPFEFLNEKVAIETLVENGDELSSNYARQLMQ